MKDLLEQPLLLMQITNGKLLATSNTENKDVDGKQEPAVLGEQNENGVATEAVNGVAPADASLAAVAIGC